VFSRILVLPAGVTSDDKTDVTPAILSRDFVACACDKVADAATVELHAATSSHRKHGFCTAFPVSRSSFTNTLAQFRNVMLIWFGLFTRQSRSVQLDNRSVCASLSRAKDKIADVTSVFYDGDDEELLRLQSCERRSRYGEGCSRANRTNIAALRFSSSFPSVFLSASV